jgi:hypothetical protein
MLKRLLIATSLVLMSWSAIGLPSLAATPKANTKTTISQPPKAKINIMAIQTPDGPLIWDSKGNFAYIASESGEIGVFKGTGLKFDYKTNSLVGQVTHKRTGRISRDTLILDSVVEKTSTKYRFELYTGVKIGLRAEDSQVNTLAIYRVIQKQGLTNAMSIPLSELDTFIDSNLVK